MTDRETLYPLARRAFWGFFLVLLNFNLTFNGVFALQLLPSALGYLLLAGVARDAAPLRPSMKLLAPLALALAVWHVQDFFPPLEERLPRVLGLLAGVVTLYFYFQFFTDLSALAGEVLPDDPRPQDLLGARNLLVVVSALLYCYDLILRMPLVGVIALVVTVVLHIYILVKLWGLKKALAPEVPL